MTEAQLQSAVIECARLLGWRVAHFRPALTSKGYRTAVEADGAGWPDLFMVHPSNGMAPYAVELKAAQGRLSPEQRAWLELLQIGGCYTAVWTPADWTSGHIEHLLRLRSEVAA